MARRAQQKTSKARSGQSTAISLADQLFIAATTRYNQPEQQFLPTLSAPRAAAINLFREKNATKLAPVEAAPAAKQGRVVRGIFFKSSGLRWTTRAAVFLAAVSGALVLFTYVLDDTIRIEDELGKSAMGSEFGAQGKSVSLSVMRKRRKIGEITVAQGSRLKVVKTSNGESFRSEVAFAGTEADFKLKYKGKASVIVNNGPFKAKVRIQPGSENDVHLKFREMASPQPVGEPQFAIEVIKGDVQIAEIDDGDEFEQYKAGEKAVFTVDDSESL